MIRALTDSQFQTVYTINDSHCASKDFFVIYVSSILVWGVFDLCWVLLTYLYYTKASISLVFTHKLFGKVNKDVWNEGTCFFSFCLINASTLDPNYLCWRTQFRFISFYNTRSSARYLLAAAVSVIIIFYDWPGKFRKKLGIPLVKSLTVF